MSDVGKRDVERLLRAHYRAERGAPDEMSKAAALAAVRAAVAAGEVDKERHARYVALLEGMRIRWRDRYG